VAAGLKQEETLWTTPNTFVASANCGCYCGANVDFVDIDPRTYNMSPDALERKLKQARESGKLPKILVPVHFAGQACEMTAIAELAAAYGIQVIEDASHAIGGRYRGAPIGDCSFSDMTVFSFHPVKIITTGEGGMIVTNRPELHEKLIRLRSHGITRDPDSMEGGPQGAWYYQQIELGFNYRMTDIQAALGESQLKRIAEFIERRHVLAERYNKALRGMPLTLPWQHPDCYSAYHLYPIRLNTAELSKTRRQVFDALRSAGILVNVHYIPVHTQPYFLRMGFQTGDFPESENYYSGAISLPMYFGLSESDQDYIVSSVQEALS